MKVKWIKKSYGKFPTESGEREIFMYSSDELRGDIRGYGGLWTTYTESNMRIGFASKLSKAKKLLMEYNKETPKR